MAHIAERAKNPSVSKSPTVKNSNSKTPDEQDNEMTDRSFLYSNDEMTSARSLRTLKTTNVHTKNVPKDTSNDVSSKLLGTQYLRKRSMSESDIEPQDWNSGTKNMVSKNKYGKHCTTKSLGKLTLNCIFSTYKYTYVTAVCTETETDDFNKNLSVV